jgi:hypothetical protein
MVMQEIYILQKHANFSAQYVENLPTWKRRYYIHLLEEEVEQIKAKQESESRKMNSRAKGSKFK